MEILSDHWGRLVAMLVLLAMSALFSGAETAFFNLSRSRIRKLRADPSILKALVGRLAARPRSLLVSVLLGNLAVSIAYFSIAADLSYRAGAGGAEGTAVAVSAGAVVLYIFTGEFLPKGVALRRPEGVALAAVLPIYAYQQVIFPVRLVLEQVGRATTRIFAGKSLTGPYVTPDELKAFVRLSGAAGGLQAAEQEMLEDAIEFGGMRVREVVVPRVDMGAVDLDSGREGVLEVARRRRLSKVVVYEGTRDRVLGYIAVKDLLYRPEEGLDALLREMPAVPETKTVESLLREFKANRAPMALVLDEYGGTEGIVTPEDLLEVVMGEIVDEYDVDTGGIRRITPERLIVAGDVTLREWEEAMGVELPSGRYETVAGYVMSTLGRIPRPGDHVPAPGHRLTVFHVRGGRVVTLIAEGRSEDDDD